MQRYAIQTDHLDISGILLTILYSSDPCRCSTNLKGMIFEGIFLSSRVMSSGMLKRFWNFAKWYYRVLCKIIKRSVNWEISHGWTRLHEICIHDELRGRSYTAKAHCFPKITLQWRHMGTRASQITNLTIVYSTVYSGADQRKHRSSASLAFVKGIHRWPVNSPHKGPVTRKMFPFDDVILYICEETKPTFRVGNLRLQCLFAPTLLKSKVISLKKYSGEVTVC